MLDLEESSENYTEALLMKSKQLLEDINYYQIDLGAIQKVSSLIFAQKWWFTAINSMLCNQLYVPIKRRGRWVVVKVDRVAHKEDLNSNMLKMTIFAPRQKVMGLNARDKFVYKLVRTAIFGKHTSALISY